MPLLLYLFQQVGRKKSRQNSKIMYFIYSYGFRTRETRHPSKDNNNKKKNGVRSDLYHQSSNEDPPNKRIKRYM